MSDVSDVESVWSSLSSTCTTTSSQDHIDVSLFHSYILGSIASDQKYRYLSAFEVWVRGATFYPVHNATDVKVRVELETVDLPMEGSSCEACCKKAKDSEIWMQWLR